MLARNVDTAARRKAMRLLIAAYARDLDAAVGSDEHFHTRLWVAALQWALGLYEVAPDIEEYERLVEHGVALRPLPVEQEDMLQDEEYDRL